MSDCTNCAGTGTTIIAVIALILVIIFIIIALIFYFYPSTQNYLDIRGINYSVTNGTATGASGSITDSLNTGTNVIYMSKALSGNITLNINSSSTNFVGMTIAVKNNTPASTTTPPATTPNIKVTGNNVVIIDRTVNPGIVIPGAYAIYLFTGTTASQEFTRLQ